MSDEVPPLGDVLRALSLQEPLLRSLATSLPAGVFVADAGGSTVYSNPRLHSIIGLTSDEVRGDGWATSIDPHDRSRVLEEWLDAVARRAEWQSEFRCRHRDGTLVAVAARSVPLRDDAGRVAGHVGSIEDISLRKRLHTKLGALIEASRLLLGSPRLEAVLPATLGLAKDLIAADGYAVWRLGPDGEWRAVASDGISADFAGPVPQAQAQRTIADIGPFSTALTIEDVHDAPSLVDRRAAYAAEGICSALVVPLHIGGAVSGSLVFYYRTRQRFDSTLIETATALGNLAAVAISTAELYEDQLAQRIRAEKAQQQATFLAEAGLALGSSLDYEATLRTVAQLAVPRIADWCAVDMLDADGRFQRLAVAHVDPAKIELARTLRERYPTDPGSRTSEQQLIRTGQPVMMSSIPDTLLVAAARDAEHLRAMRELGITSFIAVPLVAHGRTLGVITFVTAESARPYASEDLHFAKAVADRAALAVDNARIYGEAQAANRAKDEFLATLSHELRTPINAIMGWAQMLQRGVVDPSRTSHAIDAIVRNASAQGRLIEDLLDLSRIVSGKLRLDVELLDPGTVVSAASASIEPAAHAKSIRLQTVVDEGGARVYGDRQRLQQAVWNLLANAVKFTPRGGRVQTQVLRVNSHIEIVVSDTGEGIRADVLPFVFDRFRQADSSSTREHAGLGLGLAIVRHIVELHGGTVEAASDGPGTGATFRLKLPVATLAEEARGVRHPAVPTVTTGSLATERLPDLDDTRVLVVEDEPDARDMVAYLLRQRRADVVTVGSVTEALATLDREVPDVLLSDIEMPGRDGYDLITAVRARPPESGGQVPAAALTAYSRAEDRARSMLAGYDAHLSKPVDLAELVATVARLHARRRHTGPPVTS